MYSENFYKNKHLHIVAFDIPVPVNYGGVIDVFYKIKELFEAGVKITLHCYEYDRKPSKILNRYCENVFYYKREVSKTHLFKFKPYIVATRNSKELLTNLLKDDSPILFEGLHSCYYLNHSKLKSRRKIVRTHNVEHDYYSNLAKAEKDLFKKYYYINESSKLKTFEKVLTYAQGIAVISKNDFLHFSNIYKNVQLVSAFHPHENVNIKEGFGKYALYHGSLDVAENNEAAMFLVQKIFNDLNLPLVIAGNKVSKSLKQAVSETSHITIKSNVRTEEIYQLIEDAHINILPTFQATGIKLKLLAALYGGRFCIVNTPMVVNTGLEKLCILADDEIAMKEAVVNTFKKPFSIIDIEKRDKKLSREFSNSSNINQLLPLLFPSSAA